MTLELLHHPWHHSKNDQRQHGTEHRRRFPAKACTKIDGGGHPRAGGGGLPVDVFFVQVSTLDIQL
ncbi:hypothetical protein D3C76_927600 [compost metagenome]